jgi:hypothetical protein
MKKEPDRTQSERVFGPLLLVWRANIKLKPPIKEGQTAALSSKIKRPPSILPVKFPRRWNKLILERQSDSTNREGPRLFRKR